jgi:uncharacterized protein
MDTNSHPQPITISKTEARRFMLAHHGLYPPRQRQGKDGVLDYIRQVGCIQFDPINIVGRNPDLVLQSRVKDYRPSMLDELLYSDRKLLDGWDKMASVYALADWPNFTRRREWLREHKHERRPPQEALEDTLEQVGQRGPVSSLDFKETKKVDWSWGPTKIVRACLEQLFSEGHVGVDHRVNNRRSFDLIERLVPAEVLSQLAPFETEEDYQNWHVQRRVGSMGLAQARTGDCWGGILGVGSRERQATIKRLIEQRALIPINITEIPEKEYYVRRTDLAILESIQKDSQPSPGAAFIAALDNFIWNRNLIEELFNFHYRWEVYKPKTQREYGYYVLPVIYGDRFIARIDPSFDKKKRILSVNNWWWESGVELDDEMKSALSAAWDDFVTYLDGQDIVLGKAIQNQAQLNWMQ